MDVSHSSQILQLLPVMEWPLFYKLWQFFPSYTVVRELRVHELSQTDLVTLYQLHLLVWENYYILYVHLIF